MLLKRKGGAREDHQDGEPCPPTARSKGPVMSTSWGTVGTGKQHREAGTVFLSPIEGSPSGTAPGTPLGRGLRLRPCKITVRILQGENRSSCGSQLLESGTFSS